MNSMTGYGRGEAVIRGARCVVECASVNRKGIEVACQMPREIAALEVKIRETVLSQVSRGRVNVSITLPESAAGETTSIDFATAANLAKQARELQSALRLAGDLDINTFLTLPGVLRPSPQSSADLWPSIREALLPALDAMIVMRKREGAHLDKDLRKRLRTLAGLTARMKKYAPQIAAGYRESLEARLAGSGISLPVDENRLAAEIAIFAERSDVSEELTRLESHYEQFAGKLDGREPAGRALEFLTQEIFRELNTLGAKAGDSKLSRLVVESKVELDKIREQISNVE